MFHPAYEDVVRFASEGRLDAELRLAKVEFVAATGDIFESDPSFERRIAAFLEWYVCDRPVSYRPPLTPMALYLAERGEVLPAVERLSLSMLTQTLVSLFEFRGLRAGALQLTCLLSGRSYTVIERRRPAGLEPADILEARLVPRAEHLVLSDAIGYTPREAVGFIRRAAGRYRKGLAHTDAERLRFVQRVAYLTNRCERYRHVGPKTLFAELLTDVP